MSPACGSPRDERGRPDDGQVERQFTQGRVRTLLAAYGIDPHSWQLVTFTLHAHPPVDVPEDAAVFQLLHVAAPEHDRLPRRVDTRMVVPR